MKKLLFLLVTGISLFFVSCASNSDIDNLQSQIDELKSGRIASIENQIFNINGSITTLQEADREIKGYITALQNTASELQKSINTANGKIDDLHFEYDESNAFSRRKRSPQDIVDCEKHSESLKNAIKDNII